MAKNDWCELAMKSIGQSNRSLRRYDGNLEGEHGILILSEKSLLFVGETGFLRKQYTL